ncbi:ATP-binding protein [Treponema sp. Marseille-Q3903]|uniref:ATP-binding protein n=1 Tax=Treponema sp. Marseille-Q3903 TaxID=2766703 RepID=UPI00165290C3|nr:ATP-binding protein [Treponema sp. Marseille-Q3903]MBC6714559.1 ATP-binding protein [Treponema sp. Marseille-Q3903]
MEIERDYYLKKLISRRNNGMVKVITGLRRCGKSYLLFTIFKDYLLKSGIELDHIIEIQFDDFAFKKYRKAQAAYDFVKEKIKDEKQYYILLDEVQLLEEFEDVLNRFLHIKNVDTYVTCSNAKFLSTDIITEFRGRGDEVHINPLCFYEFMSIYKGTVENGWKEFSLYGGLPPVVLLESPEQKSQYLKTVFAETYLADIIERNKIRNAEELEELINILSSSIGSLTNPKKLADTFLSVKKSKISQETIKKYLEYLSDSFLINASFRYDIKGKRYIETPLKYYFSDIGLRNARLNFRQLEETHTMENIIYNELLRRGYNVDVGVVQISEKNNEGTNSRVSYEIDFVVNKGYKRYYIQSAFDIPDRQKMIQEERPFLNIKDSFKKIIIEKNCLNPYYTEEGIFVMGVFDFLLDENSLEK